MSRSRFRILRPIRSASLGLLMAFLFCAARGASAQPSPAITVLHSFAADGSEGCGGSLALGMDGNFYGICASGGSVPPPLLPSGTAFKITPDGTFTKLHDFTGAGDGGSPTVLILGADGNFYGLTSYATIGTTGYWGTFFMMTPAGAVTTLHLFPFDRTEGVTPNSLVQGSDLNFYGTCAYGGAVGGESGTVFQISGGALTVIHAFAISGAEGQLPQALIQGSDGDFYGTTGTGGAPPFYLGTIFRITSIGTVTTLHDFQGPEGEGLHASLMQASDANFYGTSFFGGANLSGTVFKMTQAGVVTVFHNFLLTYSSNPYGPLIQATDGNFYGTAPLNGGSCCGSLFQLTPSGSFTMFQYFGGDIGSGPGPLVQGNDGSLYGAAGGGVFGVGVIFKHTLPPSVLSLAPPSGLAAGGTSLTINGTTYGNGATVTIGGQPAAVPTFSGPATSTQLVVTTPALAAGTLNDVTVTNPDTSFGTLQNGWFADFLDVPQADIFHSYVEKLIRNGITAGCGGGNYCRNNPVTRAQMAVFLLKAEHGSGYKPPFCTGIFPDVPCTPGTGFPDWIEELSAEGITGGCGGGNYCPGNPVTRQQMAVFLLKTEHGSSYVPPMCAGIFGDVTCPSQFADWIEQLYAENVTGGCQTSPLLYCPGSSVTRGQMSAFLTKTFNLP